MVYWRRGIYEKGYIGEGVYVRRGIYEKGYIGGGVHWRKGGLKGIHH